MTAVGSNDDSHEDIDSIIISPIGDLILDVLDDSQHQRFSYRVEADRLRPASQYFTSLLHPTKFWEGISLSHRLEDLLERYGDIEDAPERELSRIEILDVGRIGKVNSIRMVMADFLRALHGLDLSTPTPVVPNLANLTIVADRFDAVPAFARHVRRKKYLQTIDSKTHNGKRQDLSEERVRQKLMIGALLDYPPWVAMYSKRLIIKNSVMWNSDAAVDDNSALWWDLPYGMEGS